MTGDRSLYERFHDLAVQAENLVEGLGGTERLDAEFP